MGGHETQALEKALHAAVDKAEKTSYTSAGAGMTAIAVAGNHVPDHGSRAESTEIPLCKAESIVCSSCHDADLPALASGQLCASSATDVVQDLAEINCLGSKARRELKGSHLALSCEPLLLAQSDCFELAPSDVSEAMADSCSPMPCQSSAQLNVSENPNLIAPVVAESACCAEGGLHVTTAPDQSNELNFPTVDAACSESKQTALLMKSPTASTLDISSILPEHTELPIVQDTNETNVTIISPLVDLPPTNPKEGNDGCVYWNVVVQKESSADKFGFVHANGKLDFESRLAGNSDNHQCLIGPQVLIVRKIQIQGLLASWNLRHPEARVCPHDRICMVNGQATVEGMQMELRKREKVSMKVARYPDRFVVA